ncbi:hypothetical protein LINPERPRIM_LOCUS40875 [Linum perenne]
MQTDHLPDNVTPPPAPPAGGGGGVCLKCGYSFPKQNPSSKQRRAHRKICPGNTLEVPAPHQLQASYSFVSANDHPSDDDGEFKTPSPSVLERSQFEMGSGGTGGKSNRSEDDVFSDAVTDFVDPGSSALGLQQHKDIEGPVDVLSTQSDMPVSVDGEAGSGGEAGKYSRKIRNGPPEGQETDMFEAPSFMTLVEPRRGSASEIQNPQELKAGASPDRAGWFPSITNVVNESQGRKKNEEIIAKVTTKQQQQQHTPLKSLLGEANEEMKLRVATKKEKTEVVKTTEAGGAVRRMEEGVTVEGKEWDSSPPGREKRKVKGRPYWAHLVCCASVN